MTRTETKIEELERAAKNLQDQCNEQYEENKRLKSLVLLLIAFTFNKDWLSVKDALDMYM